MANVDGAKHILTVKDARSDPYLKLTDQLRVRLQENKAARSKDKHPITTPSFADIKQTHLLYLHSSYKPFVDVASQYTRSDSGMNTITSRSQTHVFKLPPNGDFISDCALMVKIKAFGEQNPVVNTTNKFRFCAYPGIRLLKNVEFKSDGVLIDDYTRDDIALANSFEIRSDARVNWQKQMGQQHLKYGEFNNDNQYTGCVAYKDGLQTQKFYHAETTMFIPLQFWFCKDASRALKVDQNRSSQREIIIEFASLGELVQEFDQLGVPQYISAGGSITSSDIGDLQPLSLPSLDVTVSLYVNNLVVNPEIRAIFASRITAELVRVHRRQVVTISSDIGSIQLTGIKYPLEYFYAGMRDAANKQNFDHWHLFGRAATRTDSTNIVVPSLIWNPTLNVNELVARVVTEGPDSSLEPIVDTIGITVSAGVVLYPVLPTSFYNSHIPGKYSYGSKISPIASSVDTSTMLVSFCLYPGSHDPSGFFHTSTSRELCINYTASTVSASVPAELIVSASTLNFIIYSGDKIGLRFST
jgi:hypothetical protein